MSRQGQGGGHGIDKMGRINLRPLDLKIPDDLPDSGRLRATTAAGRPQGLKAASPAPSRDRAGQAGCREGQGDQNRPARTKER